MLHWNLNLFRQFLLTGHESIHHLQIHSLVLLYNYIAGFTCMSRFHKLFREVYLCSYIVGYSITSPSQTECGEPLSALKLLPWKVLQRTIFLGSASTNLQVDDRPCHLHCSKTTIFLQYFIVEK